MTKTSVRPSRAPRLVTRVLAFSFVAIAGVLATVFLVFTWQARSRFTALVTSSLETSQQRVGEVEARRQRERLVQVAMLVENPTLKATIDTYQSERDDGAPAAQLVGTLRGELAKMQRAMGVPVLAVTDASGRIVAAVGPLADEWTAGTVVAPRLWLRPDPIDAVVARGTRTYLATVVPLVLHLDVVGEFVLAAPLDDDYARALAADAHADVAVLYGGTVIGASVPVRIRAALERATLADRGAVLLDGDEYVVQRLSAVDGAAVYALGSIGAATRTTLTEAAAALALVGLGAVLLAAVGSIWLARTLARPIDELTTTVARMARERQFQGALVRAGAVRELDELTDVFNALRASVQAAEAESEATYLGVIGTLAAALDARDRYTAGHSERVAELSVTLGRQLGLHDPDLDTLRIGALLHDIGKIGVPDAVLRKPGRLTDEEFAQIELHPTIGARILKPLRFLPEVIAIVELHHEQPDGSGYPLGLAGDAIPFMAAIVHVADAFDAITSARAYRPGRPVADAIAELRRCAGTGFAPAVVQALTALPLATLDASTRASGERFIDGVSRTNGAVLPFRVQLGTGGARHSVGR